MPDQTVTQSQASFGGGLNAVASPHLLSPDEVQAATNVDFSLEWGAAPARQGCAVFGSGASFTSGQVRLIVRNYGLSTGTWNDPAIPWYVGMDTGLIYGGSGSSSRVVWSASALNTGGGAQDQVIPCASLYEGYLYIANGTDAIRTNGANTFEWLIPQADQPVVSLVSQFQASIAFVGFAGTGGGTGNGTYTATEGSITGSATTTTLGSSIPVILATATTGTGSRISLIGTFNGAFNWESPSTTIVNPGGTGVTNASNTWTVGGQSDFHTGWPGGDITGVSGPWNGTSTITQTMSVGAYGTDYLLLALPSQQNVVTVQRDLSIGDASFTNYWHAETTPGAINDISVDPVTAMLTAQGQNTIEVQQNALNINRGLLPHAGAASHNNVAPIRKSISKTTISASFSPWGVNRSDYQFIGTLPTPDFTNIRAIRVIIEFSATGQTAVVGGCCTFGGLAYPLTDQVSGVSYYQTFARVENGFIVAEGAPSLPSAPQKCEFANAQLSCAPTPSNVSGFTHRVFYRTGGLLSDAYRIGSCSIGAVTGSSTFFDYALPDMLVINNPPLRRYLWSQWPSPSAGTGLPGVNALSLPWQDRIWIGVQNQLYWTYPGIMTQIQDNSQTTVGDSGDNIQAIVPGANLVIINQASVFEMAGSIFEGASQNWSLTRTSARRGCAAPRTAVNTPEGVLLLGYDGVSFYRPGYGVDIELPWLYEKIGDLWKGTGATDPAQVKGRIPALNLPYIFNSCAAYKDGKIYLAVPTGSATLANVVFVIDLAHQKVWMYTYPFLITSLFWDRVGNRIVAGTDVGVVMQLETGISDSVTTGTTQGITWSVTTRAWSTPDDQLLENIQGEGVGTLTWSTVRDGSATAAGTSTTGSRAWSPISLAGNIADSFALVVNGTQSATRQELYQLQWDAYPQPARVKFFLTNPVAVPSENYVKTYLADLNVGTGTVTGAFWADGQFLQNSLFTPVAGVTFQVQGRKIYEVGLPNITALKNVSVQYVSTTPFRYYGTDYEFEPKPFGKLTWLVTYKKAGGVTQADMARFFAMDIEGTSTTTITNTWIIDGSAFSTNTLVFGASDVGEETGIVRNYLDQIPFPPGARGYLFQQQITGAVPFRVWKANLDIDRIGIKGLSRVTQAGTPA